MKLWHGATIGAVLLCALFAMWVGWACYLSLRVRVALAEEQTLYFEEAIQQGKAATNSVRVVDLMEAVKNYYPSGSKQKTGSHLDLMVERSRKQALEFLRRKQADIDIEKRNG